MATNKRTSTDGILQTSLKGGTLSFNPQTQKWQWTSAEETIRPISSASLDTLYQRLDKLRNQATEQPKGEPSYQDISVVFLLPRDGFLRPKGIQFLNFLPSHVAHPGTLRIEVTPTGTPVAARRFSLVDGHWLSSNIPAYLTPLGISPEIKEHLIETTLQKTCTEAVQTALGKLATYIKERPALSVTEHRRDVTIPKSVPQVESSDSLAKWSCAEGIARQGSVSLALVVDESHGHRATFAILVDKKDGEDKAQEWVAKTDSWEEAIRLANATVEALSHPEQDFWLGGAAGRPRDDTMEHVKCCACTSFKHPDDSLGYPHIHLLSGAPSTDRAEELLGIPCAILHWRRTNYGYGGKEWRACLPEDAGLEVAQVELRKLKRELSPNSLVIGMNQTETSTLVGLCQDYQQNPEDYSEVSLKQNLTDLRDDILSTVAQHPKFQQTKEQVHTILESSDLLFITEKSEDNLQP